MEDTIPVRVIETKGTSALVEWEPFPGEQAILRTYVPKEMVVEGACSEEVLRRGIPYGLSWETLLDLSGVNESSVTIALRRAGIWTFADLQQHDRALIRIGTDLIGKAVWAAAKRAPK